MYTCIVCYYYADHHTFREELTVMPMIDVYATPGTFADPTGLATTLARTLMEVEQVPPISLFKENTAAFVHDVAVANANGDTNYVRVQVITNAGALDRDKQLDAARQLTDAITEAVGDPSQADRTWVILTETYDGGWGIAGHANTNQEIIGLARAELST